jgi:SAM-dependent methyltransferase
VIAHGRLYLRFDNQLFCYDISSELENDQPDTRLVKHLPPKLDPSLGDRRLPEPIYVPTPADVVTRMLREVDLKPGQKLVDLGSGDGRIVIEAAKSFGARAVGYELDAELVALSRAAIAKEQLIETARIEAIDMYAADLSNVDVLALYLYPVVMDEIRKQINHMPAGARIVSHQFKFPEIEPENVVTMQSVESGEKHTIFLYRLPLKETVR